FAVVVVLAWSFADRLGDLVRGIPAAVRVGAVVAAAVALVAGLARYEDRYNSTRFAGLDPAIDWLQANTTDGRRIGIAGAWTDQGVAPIYPAFGDRLQNDVSFIGPREDGLLGHHTTEAGFVADLDR